MKSTSLKASQFHWQLNLSEDKFPRIACQPRLNQKTLEEVGYVIHQSEKILKEIQNHKIALKKAQQMITTFYNYIIHRLTPLIHALISIFMVFPLKIDAN